MRGKLYLIPTLLGDSEPQTVLSGKVFNVIPDISHFIVENLRNARRFLVKTGVAKPVDQISFSILNKHTPRNETEDLILPALKGYDIGLLSEAGIPCVADPGAEIVMTAHRKGITVSPLTGPSSITLALMSSGLNGQEFAFNGYLPVKKGERKEAIKVLEKRLENTGQTQIFMETPYRNRQMMAELLGTCKDDTYLCVACDLTLPSEFTATKTISHWKKKIPELNKRPAIFIIGEPYSAAKGKSTSI